MIGSVDDGSVAAITASIMVLLLCTGAALRWATFALSSLYRRGLWSPFAYVVLGAIFYMAANEIEQTFVLVFRLADYGLLPREWRDVGYYSPHLVVGRKLLMAWGALMLAHTLLSLVRAEAGRARALLGRSFFVVAGCFGALFAALYVLLSAL